MATAPVWEDPQTYWNRTAAMARQQMSSGGDGNNDNFGGYFQTHRTFDPYGAETWGDLSARRYADNLAQLGFTGAVIDPNNPNSISPEFRQWIDQNGYSLRVRNDENVGGYSGLFDRNGNLVQQFRSPGAGDNLTMALSALFAAPVAAAAIGGAAGGGVAGGEAGGLGGAADAGAMTSGASLGGAGGAAGGAGGAAGGLGGAAGAGGGAAGLGGAAGAGGGAAGAAGGAFGGAGAGWTSLIPTAIQAGTSIIQGNAANAASRTQANAAQAGIDEVRRQFDVVQHLLNPYNTAGTDALSAQRALLGLNGADAQAQAIAGIKSSPQFTAAQQSGTDSILANASATGGLRGGNVQAALGQFSPQLLSQLIQQQYGNLSGLSSLGENAAAGTGNAAQATGTNVANLLGQQGAAVAGGQLATGRAWGQVGNAAATALGQYFSDERLKTDIVPLGMTRRGNRLYRWNWKASGQPGAGVIAQEVEHIPGAVATDPATGFKTVDYSRV